MNQFTTYFCLFTTIYVVNYFFIYSSLLKERDTDFQIYYVKIYRMECAEGDWLTFINFLLKSFILLKMGMPFDTIFNDKKLHVEE